MKNIVLIVALSLITVSLANAQVTKRIKLTACGDAVSVVGNLTKKSVGYLYLFKLSKGQKVQFSLSAKPNYKEIGINLYHDNASYDSKLPILQGKVGKDYEFVVEETGEYSIMIYANRKIAKFSFVLDIDNSGWKC